MKTRYRLILATRGDKTFNQTFAFVGFFPYGAEPHSEPIPVFSCRNRDPFLCELAALTWLHTDSEARGIQWTEREELDGAARAAAQPAHDPFTETMTGDQIALLYQLRKFCGTFTAWQRDERIRLEPMPDLDQGLGKLVRLRCRERALFIGDPPAYIEALEDALACVCLFLSPNDAEQALTFVFRHLPTDDASDENEVDEVRPS